MAVTRQADGDRQDGAPEQRALRLQLHGAGLARALQVLLGEHQVAGLRRAGRAQADQEAHVEAGRLAHRDPRGDAVEEALERELLRRLAEGDLGRARVAPAGGRALRLRAGVGAVATPSPSESALRGSVPRACSAAVRDAVAVDVGVAGVTLAVGVQVGLVVARQPGQLSGPVIVMARTSAGSAPISVAAPARQVHAVETGLPADRQRREGGAVRRRCRSRRRWRCRPPRRACPRLSPCRRSARPGSRRRCRRS